MVSTRRNNLVPFLISFTPLCPWNEKSVEKNEKEKKKSRKKEMEGGFLGK